MQRDSRGSSPYTAHSGNNSFPSPAALETGRGTVPLQVYQQVAEELESARQQVSHLSLENQRLRALHQQLSGEIAALEQEFQGHLGQILKRLQQLNLRLADSSQQAEREASATPWQRDNPPSSAYDFLNRLKQRQARSEASPFSGNGYSPRSGLAAPPFEPLQRSHSSSGSLCSSQETPKVPPSPQDNYRLPSLEELMQDKRDPDLYPKGVYQRVRERRYGSQEPSLLWIAAAILLVVGSFGLGFVAVQPFLRSSPPSTQAPQ